MLIGFRGLGLLRGWPFQDPGEADAQIREIAALIDQGADRDLLDVEVLECEEAFSAWAAVYDPSVNPLIIAEEPVLRALVEGLEHGVALDLGSGTGRVSSVLRQLGHDVFSLDGSLSMLLRDAAGEGRSRRICGDLHALPFADASFDLVVCGLSLTHVRRLEGPVSEAGRVVRPGGTVVLTDIHPLAVATGAHAFFAREDGTPAVTANEVHWPSEYVEACRAAGLRVERLLEPTFDRSLLDRVSEADLKAALEVSVVGLPYVLAWLLRRGE